jgi:aspartate carbamoyltransferase catalytic subunit
MVEISMVGGSAPVISVSTLRQVRHLVSIDDLNREDIERIFTDTKRLAQTKLNHRRQIFSYPTIGVMFYQPSTRTRLSFETAIKHLGGSSVGFSDYKITRAGDYFAESLEDMVRMLAGMVDCLVIRHFENGAAQRAAEFSHVPVINAGDGSNEHPTQALCDLWMIKKMLGAIDGIRIALIGDPHCRATRSLLFGLTKFKVSEVVFCPPDGICVNDQIVTRLGKSGIPWRTCAQVMDIISDVDVIWMIPFSLPDFHVSISEGTGKQAIIDARFRLTKDKILAAKKKPIILHTGPRGNELDIDLDEWPRMLYFQQVREAIYVRMALLSQLLGINE